MRDPRVADAFVECFMAEPKDSQIPWSAVEHTLLGLDRKAVTPVTEKLIPRVLAVLNAQQPEQIYWESYASWTRTMLFFLGQLAEPGDEAVLRAIAQTKQEADTRFVRPPDEMRKWRAARLREKGEPPDVAERLAQRYPPEDVREMQRARDRVLEGVLFAQANLGDKDALAAYANDVLTGTPEIRLSRLKLLPRFHPTREVLDLTLRLLDDRTELERYRLVHSARKDHRRSCDLGVDALGKWFANLKELTNPPRIYRDQDIAEARRFTQEFIRTMPEGPATRPAAGKTIRIELPGTRPATRPTGQP